MAEENINTTEALEAEESMEVAAEADARDADSRDDAVAAEAAAAAAEAAAEKEVLNEAIKKIKATATEEDPKPSQQLSLRTILGGDLLTTNLVRSQIWLVLLVVAFSIIYVAFRYQCQQDLIAIDRLEGELKHAKFQALSATSTLTEKCRESHVLDVLKQNSDSLLHQADQPPFIIEVPEGDN